jgi:hypothetical protein
MLQNIYKVVQYINNHTHITMMLSMRTILLIMTAVGGVVVCTTVVVLLFTGFIENPFENSGPGTLEVRTTVVNDDHGKGLPLHFLMQISGKDPVPASFPGSAEGVEVTLQPGAYGVTQDEHTTYDSVFSPECSGTLEAGERKICTVANNDKYTPSVVHPAMKLSPKPWVKELQDNVARTFYELTGITKYDRPAEELGPALGLSGYTPPIKNGDSAVVLTYRLTNSDPVKYGGASYGEAYVESTVRIVRVNDADVLIGPEGSPAGNIIAPLTSVEKHVVLSVPAKTDSIELLLGDLEKPTRVQVDFREQTYKVVR